MSQCRREEAATFQKVGMSKVKTEAVCNIMSSLPIDYRTGSWLTLGVSFSFFYHFWNGVRHLLWDLGVGYSLKAISLTGIMVVLFSLLMTVGIGVILL